MQGAEERRLRRMKQYAARGAIESNAADNALLVIRVALSIVRRKMAKYVVEGPYKVIDL